MELNFRSKTELPITYFFSRRVTLNYPIILMEDPFNFYYLVKSENLFLCKKLFVIISPKMPDWVKKLK